MIKKAITLLVTIIVTLTALGLSGCGADVSGMTPEYDTGLMFDE